MSLRRHSLTRPRVTAFVTTYVSYLHLEELVAHYQRFVMKILSWESSSIFHPSFTCPSSDLSCHRVDDERRMNIWWRFLGRIFIITSWKWNSMNIWNVNCAKQHVRAREDAEAYEPMEQREQCDARISNTESWQRKTEGQNETQLSCYANH